MPKLTLAALAALVEEQKLAIIALEQRSNNFAARMNATHKIYRAEITRLRDTVEALTPRKSAGDRLPLAEYNAARAALGGGYQPNAKIYDQACKMREAAQPETDEVF